MATVYGGSDFARLANETATTVYSDDSHWQVVTSNASEAKIDKKVDKGGKISPRLIFKYVKRKFTKLEAQKMGRRMKHLEKLADDASDKGQVALGEEFMKKAIKELRESEIYACGFSKFIEEEEIERLLDMTGRSIVETELKNFIHPIPKKAATKIMRAIKKRLFDEYVVLHYDPDDVASEATEEEKKDPIIFGKIEESNRYYFVADWIDDYCDLTLEDVVEKLSLKDKNIKLTSRPNKIG